jgi:hypothetical protein
MKSPARRSMKAHWVALALVVAAFLGLRWYIDPRRQPYPDFAVLKAECHQFMGSSPRADALEGWLAQKNIPSTRLTAPSWDISIKAVMEEHGIPHADVERTHSCIYFWHLRVRPGQFLEGRYASGFFAFAEDGSLIGYKVDYVSYYP